MIKKLGLLAGAAALCLMATAAESGVNGGPTTHDCSGTILSSGQAQLAISAAHLFNGFEFDISAGFSNTDPINISWTITNPGAGIVGSHSLNPSTATLAGGSFFSPAGFPTGMNIYVNGATSGDKFNCTYW